MPVAWPTARKATALATIAIDLQAVPLARVYTAATNTLARDRHVTADGDHGRHRHCSAAASTLVPTSRRTVGTNPLVNQAAADGGTT